MCPTEEWRKHTEEEGSDGERRKRKAEIKRKNKTKPAYDRRKSPVYLLKRNCDSKESNETKNNVD